MVRPLSLDLRRRIVSAVEEGASIRAVAKRYGVAPSAVSKISRRFRESGSVAPRAMGGDRRSHIIEGHGDRILGLLAASPDLTLEALRTALRQEGIAVGYGGLWRFLDRHAISLKKNPARQRTGSP